jgi:hypothetical protein
VNFTLPLEVLQFLSRFLGTVCRKKLTFVGQGVSHKMCVSINSTGHTEVAMSLGQFEQQKNPVPPVSDAAVASQMEAN